MFGKSAMPLTRRAFALSLAAYSASAGVPVVALGRPALAPPIGRYHYTVLRQGDKIGTHIRNVSRQSATLVVETDIELAVKFFGITAYRYRHQSVERWRSNTLIDLESRTRKNGTRKRLHGERDGSGVLLLENHKGERRRFPESPLTTTLWHPETPHVGQLLEVEDGWMKTNAASYLGTETVQAGDRELSARHYRLDAEVERDVWYDARGLLLRVAFEHDDGSRIVMQPAETFV